MRKRDRDPVRPADAGLLGSGAAPRRLCIVSRDRLRCSDLVLTLQASLSPGDDLEIILDRRRDRVKPVDAEWPFVDRRRHPYVDLALRTNGFAIVPAASLKPFSLVELDAAAHERFENIVRVERRRRTRRWWIPAAPVGLVLTLLVLLPPVDSLLHQVLPEAPPSSGLTNELPAVARSPLVTGIPAPSDLAQESSPEAEGPREANTAPRATARATGDAASPRAANPPRAERVRPAPPSNGRVQGYAARISGRAERLLAGAKVLLKPALGDRVETYAVRISNTAHKRVERSVERPQGP